jgi:hypothetical protein
VLAMLTRALRRGVEPCDPVNSCHNALA